MLILSIVTHVQSFPFIVSSALKKAKISSFKLRICMKCAIIIDITEKWQVLFRHKEKEGDRNAFGIFMF